MVSENEEVENYKTQCVVLQISHEAVSTHIDELIQYIEEQDDCL